MNHKPLFEFININPLTGAGRDVAIHMEAAKLPYKDNRSSCIGIEIEMERLNNGMWPAALAENPAIFYHDNDGSLRDNGVEFISMPFNGYYSEVILSRFFKTLKKHEPQAHFTDRCSTHVHLDVTDLSAWQFKCLFKLYLIFEQALFRYAGEERQLSNFCVPVSYVNFERWLPEALNSWGKVLDTLPHLDEAKYSGLNVSRVRDIGTVEFRHLPGTFDTKYIAGFITSILCLKKFVLEQVSPEFIDQLIATANTESNYHDICTRIFGKDAHIMFPNGDYKLIEDGVTHAKRLFFDRTNVHRPTSFAKIISTPTLIDVISKNLPVQKDRKDDLDGWLVEPAAHIGARPPEFNQLVDNMVFAVNMNAPRGA